MRTLKRHVSTADDMAAEIKDSSVLVQSIVTLITEQTADVTYHHRNITASAAVCQSALVDAEKFNSLQKSLSLLPSASLDNSTALERIQFFSIIFCQHSMVLSQEWHCWNSFAT